MGSLQLPQDIGNVDDVDTIIIKKHFSAIGDTDVDEFMNTCHPEIIVRTPFTPDPLRSFMPEQIIPKDIYRGFMATLFTIVTPFKLTIISIEPLKRPGAYYITFRSESTFKATNRPYNNRYITKLTLRDGLVDSVTEYYDPVIFVEATGGTVTLPEL